MKKLAFILILMSIVSLGYTQEIEKPLVNQPATEKAAKGQEISGMAKTMEGGKEKGISISSAASRKAMVRERAMLGAENAAPGRERAATGAENTTKGRENAAQMRQRSHMPANASPSARPNVNVPQARPNAPVVRPNGPGQGGPANRPNTPGRPGGIPGGGI